MNDIERKAWHQEYDRAVADFARGFERVSWLMEAISLSDGRERDRVASLAGDMRMRLMPLYLEILHNAELACSGPVAPQ